VQALRVPMYDLRAEYLEMRPAIDGAIRRVLESGTLVMGAEPAAFEAEFARYCGAREAVGVGSGSAAVHLALLACGIGPGDEVITVPNTDIPTTMAISHCGARIVWVDVDPRTFTIAPERIRERLTSRTKAILPVHLFGHPADMEPIMDLARRQGLYVVEDAALATGATYRGRKVGTIGDLGCFSLAPTKILGASGDAGIITTDRQDLADRIRVLRNYGHDLSMDAQDGLVAGVRVWKLIAEGYNERLDPVHAAVVRVKLRSLDQRIARRRRIAALYGDLLRGLDLVLPFETPGATHVYRAYPVLVRNRDRVRQHLAARGIATQAYYTPLLHLQPVYRHLGHAAGSFPIAEDVANRLVCLPVFPSMSDGQVREVAAAVRQCVAAAPERPGHTSS
jgi:dTDP-4-amino-4,6-dideoxygalactose transaminase